MDDAERLRLRTVAAEFRGRAERARREAAGRGGEWWGASLLEQSAEYYDRRADDAERQLLGSRPAQAGTGSSDEEPA